MAIVKRISDSYTIQSALPDGVTTVNLGNPDKSNASVTVWGNLSVLGTQTIINTVSAIHANSEIVLNGGLTSSNQPNPYGARITVNRGNLSPAAIVWNESIPAWQIDEGKPGQDPITIATTVNMSNSLMSRVHDDMDPSLGGNLNVSDLNTTWKIVSDTNIIFEPVENTQFNTALQLMELNTPLVAPITGFDLLFAGATGSGKTGLYVTNSASINEELITKKQAIAFSLIF